MNPIRPCPRCGRDTDFHDDELEDVDDGVATCLSCGLKLEEAVMISEIAAGKHPELVDAILSRDEEGGEDEGDDDE